MKRPKFIQNLIDKISYIRHDAALKVEEVKAAKESDALQDFMSVENQKKLVAEYNLIQEKKSTLTRSQRKMIEDNVSYLIQKGILQIDI